MEALSSKLSQAVEDLFASEKSKVELEEQAAGAKSKISAFERKIEELERKLSMVPFNQPIVFFGSLNTFPFPFPSLKRKTRKWKKRKPILESNLKRKNQS